MAVDDAVVAEDDRPFNAVFQLAHVARPVVAHHHVNSGRRNAVHLHAVLVGVLFEEVVGELEDVGFALAQGRNEDGKDIEAVEKILAKCSLSDGFF